MTKADVLIAHVEWKLWGGGTEGGWYLYKKNLTFLFVRDFGLFDVWKHTHTHAGRREEGGGLQTTHTHKKNY